LLLTVERLLDEPALGLALLAGEKGLRRRPAVRWAHVSEIPDPTPWLEGGEILLTTGLGVKDDPAAQRRLVAGLKGAGCLAVGFGLGVVLDHVPPAMLDEAEQRDLPLFTVPYEVPFIAVARHVAHHTAGTHVATLRTAVDLHRRVLASVVGDGGLDGVLRVLSKALPGLAWVVFDPYGQVLADSGRTGALADIDLAGLWRDLPHDRDRFSVAHDGGVLAGGAVRVGEHVEAVLVALGRHHPLEHEALLIEQGLTGVSLELARGRSARAVRHQQVAELLEDVAAARVSEPALAHRLRRLGFDPAHPYQALCVRGGPRLEAVADLAEDVLGGVVGVHGGGVVCLVQPPNGGHGERLANGLRAREGLALAIGRSAPKTELAGLSAGLREASAAARVPGKGGVAVRDVADLGLAGLLAALGDDAGAVSFVDHVLGRVLAHDREQGTALVESLRAYIRHGARPGPAANDLRVHRHTLTYRLDRIRELTGRDPRDGAHLVEFGLALELHRPDDQAAP
jgi:PucR family transcriptional regulator, purine catabolism regulatory protein